VSPVTSPIARCCRSSEVPYSPICGGPTWSYGPVRNAIWSIMRCVAGICSTWSRVFHSNPLRGRPGTPPAIPRNCTKRFSGTCDFVRMMLIRSPEWRMWVLCDTRADQRLRAKGRVTLLGDAGAPHAAISRRKGPVWRLEDSVCCHRKTASMRRQSVDGALAAYRASALFAQRGRMCRHHPRCSMAEFQSMPRGVRRVICVNGLRQEQ